METSDMLKNVGILLAVAVVVGCMVYYIKKARGSKRFRDKQAALPKNRAGSIRGKEEADAHYELVLQECIDSQNEYLSLEPERNEAYRKAFAGEGGVLECMSHYERAVGEELGAAAGSVEDMRKLLVGGSLSFLYSALRKLPDPQTQEKESWGKQEYLEYLRKNHINIEAEPDLYKRAGRMEQILSSLGRNTRAERRKKEKRETYEKIEGELRTGHAAELMRTLTNPTPGCTPQEYEHLGQELGRTFMEMRERYLNQ
ncbi:MAG: hypothetical protein Q4E89_08185 [Eubacteriales bacterium]|nr:hypothetical protein [Eubacteriales bacterium]